MKSKRILCTFVLIGMMANMSGCLSLQKTREPLPEDTLEEFEDAYNAMDVDGMLECMDEKSVKAMTAGMDLMMDIVGSVTEVDIDISAEDLIAMLPLFQEMIGEYGAQSGMPQVDFQVLETYIKGDKATVYFMEAGSGDKAAINMVKEDNKWRLTLSTRTISPEDADRVIIAGQDEEQEDPVKKRAEERAEKRAERKAEREAEKTRVSASERQDGAEEEGDEKSAEEDTEERKSSDRLSLLDLFDREKVKDLLLELLGG